MKRDLTFSVLLLTALKNSLYTRIKRNTDQLKNLCSFRSVYTKFSSPVAQDSAWKTALKIGDWGLGTGDWEAPSAARFSFPVAHVSAWKTVLLLTALLIAGCVVPGQVQPQPGAVVQGSTAAPTEPPATNTPVSVGIVDAPAETPAGTPAGTSAPPAETATPVAPATDTPAPPANPTVAPTSAPPETATPAPTAPPTAQPSPAPAKTPYPTGIFVASHRGFSDGSNYIVVGEVLNTGGVPVFGAKVIANFYDSGGKQVAAGQVLTSLAMTEPEVGNPFKLKVENLAAAVERYELTVTWEDVSLIEFRYLTVVEGAVGQGEVTGQIRNEQESALTSIVVAVTFYDAAGGVVETADIFLGGQTLAPGASLPFAIPIPGGEGDYDHFWIEAQGNLNLF